MRPNAKPRRRHDADLKSRVIAACNEPGASVAAVALANGLNANLVRKWLHGRGLKRAGLLPQSSPLSTPPSAVSTDVAPAANAHFIPVVLTEPYQPILDSPTGVPPAGRVATATIEVELRRGTSSLSVRWPASSGADCAQWLRDVAAGWLK